MQKSNDRILTTHVGSLPRSKALLALMMAKEAGNPVDEAALDRLVRENLDDVIARQKAAGIDVAGDGEIPRVGFSFYVKDRMSGFGGYSARGSAPELKRFPDYVAMKAERGYAAIVKSASMYAAPECQSAVHYDPAMTAAKHELDAFADALGKHGGAGQFADTFVTAATPGIVSATMFRSPKNTDYRDDEEYLFGLAAELGKEYRLIVERGHVLQLDAPDLAAEREMLFEGRPLEDFLRRAELHIRALNRAIEGIPKEKIRMHICWGNSDRPHVDDLDLEPLLPLLYQANIGALSLACASPRHQHEYKLFRKYPPPRDWLLIPGVIDVTTNIVEHPEVVADRIEQFVEVIGDRTRVIAGTDCGLSTFAGYLLVAEDVAWTKLKTLTVGAALASGRLW